MDLLLADLLIKIEGINYKKEGIRHKTRGVYIFFNSAKEPVYVGKAVNLRKRIQNHISGVTNTYWCCRDFKYLCFFEIEEETERQMKEATFIHNLKPRYNQGVEKDYKQEINEELDERREKQRLTDKKREERKAFIKSVGKEKHDDILYHLKNGFNPHMLSTYYHVDIDTVKKINEGRMRFQPDYIPKHPAKDILSFFKYSFNNRLGHLVN